MAVVAMFGFATTSVAWDVTVNVVDTDGKPADDVYVHAMVSTTGSSDGTRAEDGKVTFTLDEGQYIIIVTPKSGYYYQDSYYNSYYAKQEVTVNQDMTITLTVPKKISFKVTSKDYSGRFEFTTLDYKRFSLEKDNENRIYSGRIDPNQQFRICLNDCEYNFIFVEGTITVSDGATIRVGTFNVQSEGEGLTFPRDEFAGNSSYWVVVGHPVRLAAIPVGENKFVSWDINGKEYTDPMIDFTVKDDVTTATAKFSGDIHNFVKAADSSIDKIEVRVDGNYLVLPASVEASASIYAADGHLAKRTGVVGDRMNISDLPSGAYVLSLNCQGKLQNAKFLKP